MSQACTLIKKETLSQLVFFEFCQVFKNTCEHFQEHFVQHLPMAASVFSVIIKFPKYI